MDDVTNALDNVADPPLGAATMPERSAPADWPPSFTLDQERVLKLLTGDRFYSDPSAALREAVLNGIDAVQRRQQVSQGISPDIQVTLNCKELSLKVSDNGIGMNDDDISRLFSKVGASAATSEASKESVGEFGIGVISYFMAGDSFRVETCNGRDAPIGLEFAKSMLAGGEAGEFEPTRTKQGTTICIRVRDEETLELLEKKFSHWCRDVEGLRACAMPGGNELTQAGRDEANEVALAVMPDWVERTHLRPVADPNGWEAMTGDSAVAVLYRGVFVQEFNARGIWGIEGSIDVDPKHFKPRLNRESFVAADFEPRITEFLVHSHPELLKAMVKPLVTAKEAGELDEWTERKWANLWISIPRTDEYSEAIEAWDSVFSTLPAFQIAAGQKWAPATLEEIERLDTEIYVATYPTRPGEPSDLERAALRFLRNTGKHVIRGLHRERNWMRGIPVAYESTADLIAAVFSDRIPRLIWVAREAKNILESVRPVAPLFTGPPAVDVVKLGPESAPVLRLASKLVINVDHDAGKRIVEDALKENSGLVSLLRSTATHASKHLQEVAYALAGMTTPLEELSPLRRRFIRSRTA